MRLRDDERGVSAVVAKTFAVGLAMLYVAGMTTLLLGSIVPGYETRAGQELSERVVATAGETIEQSVPQATGTVNATTAVELPPTIEGEEYRIHLTAETLWLDHPSPAINETVQLAVPPGTTVEPATWQSRSEFEIRVTGPHDSRTLQLEQ